MTELGNPGRAPHPISALPPHVCSDASPKAISGRTSYLRVRLEFLPYPQLIPRLFNAGGFGPPCGVTRTSPWPGVDHPVSGLWRATVRPVQTRFRFGSGSLALTLPHAISRRFILQKARRHPPWGTPTDCRHTVSGSLSLRSRGPFHLSLTVLCSIGRQVVFSLGRWSSPIPTGFLVSRGTWAQAPHRDTSFAYGVLTLSDRLSQTVRLAVPFLTVREACSPLQVCPATLLVHRLQPFPPQEFGLLRVRSPLLAESRPCFLFLRVLRCFSSPGCLRTPMNSACGPSPSRLAGSPIRTPTDQGSLTAPRGISVFAPSFVGTWRLGILRAPFVPSPVLYLWMSVLPVSCLFSVCSCHGTPEVTKFPPYRRGWLLQN